MNKLPERIRPLDEKSPFLTSTGSLLPVGRLGVFALRGVFVEEGVFGLNRNTRQFNIKTTNQITLNMFYTYIGRIII